MKAKENKTTILESDFEYLIKFEKYIREYESDIYKKAFNWAINKNNKSYYANRK
tara:strand:- start:357 stop:518 length:162 start_codon:yes stop_codon:yes gene_type:complete